MPGPGDGPGLVGWISGAVAVLSTFFLPSGPTAWIYPIAILAGIGFSANWVFPWAMVPDVVEYDRPTTGASGVPTAGAVPPVGMENQ